MKNDELLGFIRAAETIAVASESSSKNREKEGDLWARRTRSLGSTEPWKGRQEKKWNRGKNLKFNERHLSFFPLSHSPFTLAFTLAPLTESPRWTALPNLSSGTHCPYAWGELRRFPAFLKPRRRKISNAGKRWNRPRCSKLVP